MLTRPLAAASLVVAAAAQTVPQDGNCSSVEQCLPILAKNDEYAPKKWNRQIGGQNFTWCCTKAVADSLAIDAHGRLVTVDDAPVVDLNATLLKESTDNGLFPCNADYNSEFPEGSPAINVNYTWVATFCPGWQLNQSQNLNVLQTISGFLLPAVIFCLSVPRRRKFHVLRKFFVADFAGITSYVPAFFGAIGAMIIVTLDTLLWLSVCFALAGPMILSGLYEALLDSRIIDFVREKGDNGRLTLDMKCRLLMMVLIGNLDLAIDDDPLANPRGQNIPINGTSPNLDPRPEPTSNPPAKSFHEHEETRNSSYSAGPQPERTPEPHSNHRSMTMPVIHFDDGREQVGEIFQTQISDDVSGLGIRMGHGNGDSLGSDAYRRRLSSSRAHQMRADDASIERGLIQRRNTQDLKASPWRHMEELLYPIRLYDDERGARQLSPRQYPLRKHSPNCVSQGPCKDQEHLVQEKPHPRNAKIDRQILKTQTRLRTMLNCQYSFGSMVGAPVLFFLGGFVFALLQSLQDLGDEDTALALAFGQWYMTIPHIAIISGLLLAGNNPNILEGVFATQRQQYEEPRRILGLEFGLAYPSCYKVAWQWARGPNKKRWIETLISTYSEPIGPGEVPSEEYEDNQEDMWILRERTTPSSLDWCLLLFMSGLLLGVPFVLAFLTAYYTPEIGVSCRSFTFLIYTSAQFGQVMLWLWAYATSPDTTEPRTGSHQGWLARRGFFNPRSVDHLSQLHKPGPISQVLKNPQFWAEFGSVESLWCCTWYFLYGFLGILAALAAIGGTLMQIMGVYSADICFLTADQWMHPFRPGNTALVSRNSASMIMYAKEFWKPCAITAIAFMSFVSFVGWWYQRRTRDVFMGLVRDIDKHKRSDTRRADDMRKSLLSDETGQRNAWGSPTL